MIRRAFHAVLALVALSALAAAPAAHASAWLNTQHGGRGTGEAGALTARADDPSALTYNPAGIARLPGLQLQAGLDFSNATDDYESPTAGRHEANHSIQFPPALYLTYHVQGDSPWAVGVGVDTPVWYSVDWKTALFPGRFLTRETKLRLWEVHPVVAYQIDDHWSVGGGLRYITGEQDLGQNFAGRLAAVPGQHPEVPYEVKLTANGNADALSFDAGLQYATNVWGWGAVYRHSASLTSRTDYGVQVRDITDPSLAPTVVAGLGGLRVDQSFELPKELRTGVWIAPYPELRLELDAAYADWTRTETRILEPSQQGPVVGSILETRTRNWDPTLSLRFGVEGDLTDHWTVYGGAAREPSPVPDSNVEPAWPRADATVLGGGFSYNLSWISFDMSYSYWSHGDRTVSGQELAAPTVRGTYGAFEQVWAASVRWRW
jgi:long-chain fatty acid transport protein